MFDENQFVILHYNERLKTRIFEKLEQRPQKLVINKLFLRRNAITTALKNSQSTLYNKKPDQA